MIDATNINSCLLDYLDNVARPVFGLLALTVARRKSPWGGDHHALYAASHIAAEN